MKLHSIITGSRWPQEAWRSTCRGIRRFGWRLKTTEGWEEARTVTAFSPASFCTLTDPGDGKLKKKPFSSSLLYLLQHSRASHRPCPLFKKYWLLLILQKDILIQLTICSVISLCGIRHQKYLLVFKCMHSGGNYLPEFTLMSVFVL